MKSLTSTKTEIMLSHSMVGLSKKLRTGNELIRETLSYEDYLDIEVLANKLGVHSHAITKDGIYTSNCNIWTLYSS